MPPCRPVFYSSCSEHVAVYVYNTKITYYTYVDPKTTKNRSWILLKFNFKSHFIKIYFFSCVECMTDISFGSLAYFRVLWCVCFFFPFDNLNPAGISFSQAVDGENSVPRMYATLTILLSFRQIASQLVQDFAHFQSFPFLIGVTVPQSGSAKPSKVPTWSASGWTLKKLKKRWSFCHDGNLRKGNSSHKVYEIICFFPLNIL